VNILRAIAEALIHRDGESTIVHRDDAAIHSVAPARGQFDAQQAQRRTRLQCRRQRIALRRQRRDVEPARIGAAGKSRGTGEQRDPGPAGIIHRSQQQERKLGEERAMLVGHESANAVPPGALHPLGEAEAFMHGAFALVPGRQRLLALRAIRDL
jgi:hypothetical protein